MHDTLRKHAVPINTLRKKFQRFRSEKFNFDDDKRMSYLKF